MSPERSLALSIESGSEELSTEIYPIIYEAIATPFTSSVVLFGTVGDHHLAIKFSQLRNGADHEWEGLRRVYEAGIQTTQPLALAKTLEGTKVIATSKLEGSNLYVNDELVLRREFGSLVRRMHDQVYVRGVFWERSDFSDFDRISPKLKTRLKSIGSTLEKTRTLNLLNRFSGALRERLAHIKPSFVHNDLHKI